jgi:hypothetical protein
MESVRVMHYIGEFLDLDAKSFTNIAEFIALIQAIREGLGRIDPKFAVSDFHINILFLSKLQTHPKWHDWARHMLRDQRITVSDTSKTMAFHELAELAITREAYVKEKARARMAKKGSTYSHSHTHTGGCLQHYTQEEINSFVVRQMQTTNGSNNSSQQPPASNHKRHSKRPIQEEINEFVVRQMREERERITRSRSKSEPKPDAVPKIVADDRLIKISGGHPNHPSTEKCDECGATQPPGHKCLHLNNSNGKPEKPVVVQIPRANFLPKKVEFVTQTADGLPTYRTGFALT